jgi:hypothetical protein
VNKPWQYLRVLDGVRFNLLEADSQGTSIVLYGGDLKSQLCGLFAKPEFSASQGLFFAAVKDTLVVRFLGAEEVVNNSSRRLDLVVFDPNREVSTTPIRQRCQKTWPNRSRGSDAKTRLLDFHSSRQEWVGS